MAQKGKLPKIIYTIEEEDWLVTKALDYRSTIENKKTDGATKRDKDKAWIQIAKAFNVAPPGTERTIKSLREKYQKIKQSLRNRLIYTTDDANETGGGPPEKELPPLSEPMKELFSILVPSTFGLSATLFGDSDYPIPNQPTDLETPAVAASSLEYITADDQPFFYEDDGSNDVVDTLKTEEQPEMNSQPAQSNSVLSTQVNVLRSWERLNPFKLLKPKNALLHNSRQQKKESKVQIKLSEERQQHLKTKHKIELEILECERKRCKFECERAALDVQRAAFERERAELERDRIVVELKRVQNQLIYDKELHGVCMTAFQKDADELPIASILTAATRKGF